MSEVDIHANLFQKQSVMQLKLYQQLRAQRAVREMDGVFLSQLASSITQSH